MFIFEKKISILIFIANIFMFILFPLILYFCFNLVQKQNKKQSEKRKKFYCKVNDKISEN